MADDIEPYWRNFVDGAWCDGGAGRIQVVDPATGEPLAEHACADAGDVDRAVAAARRCHASGVLANMRPVERARLVRGMGEYLLARSDEIAPLLTRESGKPLWESRLEVEGSARYFEYYGALAESMQGRSIPLGNAYVDFTRSEPYGVSAQIIPWNYPIEMTARSLAPALVAGNACVVKTPELDPLTNSHIARAALAVGLPAGALNMVCGLGTVAGAALASHPGVDQIVFTGSMATGISVATAAARNVVPCVLELGGKSAAIVYADADLEQVLSSVRWGAFFNAGQACSAMSRLLVHRSRHDEVLQAISAMAQGLSVGPGLERAQFGANMGALISRPQQHKVAAMTAQAISDGARVITGAHTLPGPGCFFAPTVLADVDPAMAIAREEVFGPVLAVTAFDTEAQAIAMANGTDYGLVGGVFTRDIDQALRSARQIRAGQVFVNEWFAGGVETPFGGVGKSGYGREKGREALANYVRTKNIAIALRS